MSYPGRRRTRNRVAKSGKRGTETETSAAPLAHTKTGGWTCPRRALRGPALLPLTASIIMTMVIFGANESNPATAVGRKAGIALEAVGPASRQYIVHLLAHALDPHSTEEFALKTCKQLQ
ncbi:hypothetical protein DM02DRAFT_652336 [Periconia macrospinosa]|uniref:Uncharacterized protein n=1 Tax=Periconia macrospinosa TaxID=97972 RepID=A0A2V1E0D2_9PLEO|nr:hypothetical protein DM02DRAFT_652336 [Periconia macrospinosa]